MISIFTAVVVAFCSPRNVLGVMRGICGAIRRIIALS